MSTDGRLSREEVPPNVADIREPEIVYHYTSLDTMMKIIESRQLWATSIKFLNDTTERNLLLRKAASRLPQVIKDDPETSVEFIAEVRRRLLKERKILFTPAVVCFSRDGDSLPQWRAYTPKGLGVSIGFRAASLRKAFVDMNSVGMSYFTHPGIEFGAVNYLGQHSTETMDGVIRDCICSAHNQPWLSVLATDLCHYLENRAIFFKDQAFASENEFRLVLGYVADGRPYKYRVNDSTLVPYLVAEILNHDDPDDVYEKTDPAVPWNAVARVIVGPAADKRLTADSLKAYFKSKKMDVKVVTTKIPFRDW